MDQVPKVIDGLSSEFLEKLRQQAPHVSPLYNMIKDKHRGKAYVGMGLDEFQREVQLDEAYLRTYFKSLRAGEPYAPHIQVQVTDITAGANAGQASLMVNAVQAGSANITLAIAMPGANGVIGMV